LPEREALAASARELSGLTEPDIILNLAYAASVCGDFCRWRLHEFVRGSSYEHPDICAIAAILIAERRYEIAQRHCR